MKIVRDDVCLRNSEQFEDLDAFRPAAIRP